MAKPVNYLNYQKSIKICVSVLQFVSLRECEVRGGAGSVSLFTKLQSPRSKLTFCRSEYLLCIEEGALCWRWEVVITLCRSNSSRHIPPHNYN